MVASLRAYPVRCESHFLWHANREAGTKGIRITQKWLFIAKYRADVRLLTQITQVCASAKIFPWVGKVDILVVHFKLLMIQIQIDVHITLCSCYTTKNMTHVTATVPKMRFVGSHVSFHILYKSLAAIFLFSSHIVQIHIVQRVQIRIKSLSEVPTKMQSWCHGWGFMEQISQNILAEHQKKQEIMASIHSGRRNRK